MGSVDAEETADASFQVGADAGQVKLVINSAGQGVFGEIGSYTATDITTVLAGSLAGLILFSDHAVRVMRDSGGDIVNIISTAGKRLRAAESIYVASKWGAKGYTRTLREGLKLSNIPIRVFEIYPCGMQTNFWSQAIRPVFDGTSFPLPQEIAESVLAEVLASRRSVYCQEMTFDRSPALPQHRSLT